MCLFRCFVVLAACLRVNAMCVGYVGFYCLLIFCVLLVVNVCFVFLF